MAFITRLYHYLYYRIYRMEQAWWRPFGEPNPEGHSIVLFSLFVSLNLFVAVGSCDALFNNFQMPPWIYVGMAVIVFGMNQILLTRQRGIKRIVSEFATEPLDAYRWRSVIFYSYLVLSLASMSIPIFILRMMSAS